MLIDSSECTAHIIVRPVPRQLQRRLTLDDYVQLQALVEYMLDHLQQQEEEEEARRVHAQQRMLSALHVLRLLKMEYRRQRALQLERIVMRHQQQCEGFDRACLLSAWEQQRAQHAFDQYQEHRRQSISSDSQNTPLEAKFDHLAATDGQPDASRAEKDDKDDSDDYDDYQSQQLNDLLRLIFDRQHVRPEDEMYEPVYREVTPHQADDDIKTFQGLLPLLQEQQQQQQQQQPSSSESEKKQEKTEKTRSEPTIDRHAQVAERERVMDQHRKQQAEAEHQRLLMEQQQAEAERQKRRILQEQEEAAHQLRLQQQQQAEVARQQQRIQEKAEMEYQRRVEQEQKAEMERQRRIEQEKAELEHQRRVEQEQKTEAEHQRRVQWQRQQQEAEQQRRLALEQQEKARQQQLEAERQQAMQEAEETKEMDSDDDEDDDQDGPFLPDHVTSLQDALRELAEAPTPAPGQASAQQQKEDPGKDDDSPPIVAPPAKPPHQGAKKDDPRLQQLDKMEQQLDHLERDTHDKALAVPLTFQVNNQGNLFLDGNTPDNRLFLKYEDDITRVLLQLDNILSDGDPEIRSRRRAIVQKAEHLLDQLDRHRQQQWEKETRRHAAINDNAKHTDAAQPNRLPKIPRKKHRNKKRHQAPVMA